MDLFVVFLLPEKLCCELVNTVYSFSLCFHVYVYMVAHGLRLIPLTSVSSHKPLVLLKTVSI